MSMCKNRAEFLMPKYTVITLQLLLKGNTKWRVPEMAVSVCAWDPECQALSVTPYLKRTLSLFDISVFNSEKQGIR